MHPVIIDAAHLNFGDVFETESHEHSLPLTNGSNRTLSIRLEKSCDCLSVSPMVFELTGGETRTISVKIDLTRSRGVTSDSTRRAVQTHLTVKYGTRAKDAYSVEIIGFARSLLELSSPTIHFARELPTGKEGPEARIRFRCLVPVADVEVKPVANLDAWVRPIRDGEYMLHVRPQAQLPIGAFLRDLKIQLHAPDCSYPPQPIVVTGVAVGVVVARPSDLRLGVCQVEKVVTRTVLLQSTSGKAFKVLGVKSSLSGVVARIDSESDCEVTMHVDSNCQHLGSQECVIAVAIKPEDGPETEVHCHLLYYGIAGDELRRNP